MDWKKEYRVSDLFGRKPKAEQQPAVEPTPEPPSAPPSEPVAPPEAVPVAEVEAPPALQAPAPVEEAPAFVASVEPEPVEPAASEAPAAEAAASGPSVWKKEIRVSSLFRRGEKEEPAPGFWVESPLPEAPAEPPPEPAPAPAVGAEPETVAAAEPLRPELTEPEAPSVPAPEPSVWKKEIRVSSLFRRGEKDEREIAAPETVPVAEVEVPPALEPPPAPVEEASAFVAPSEPAGFEPFQPVQTEAPEVAAVELEPVEPAASEEPTVEVAAPEPSVWKKEIRISSLFRRGEKDEPEPAASPETVPVAEVEAPAFVVTSEPAGFEPFGPGLPEVAPVEPEPVEPAASEELAAPEPSVWKKEIRVSSLFRRGEKDEPEPVVPPEAVPVAEAPPVLDAPVAVEETPVATVEPQPFQPEAVEPGPFEGAAPGWFGPVEPTHEAFEPEAFVVAPVEPEPVAPVASEEPAAAEAPPTSVWKKEIRLGPRRGPKQPKTGGREKPGRREEPVQRERPTETRAARREARGSKVTAQLPDVPLVRSINLLPRDEPRTRAGRPSLVQVGVALLGVVALGGVSFVFMYERSRVADRRSAVEDLQTQVAAIEIPDQTAIPDQGAQLAGETLARAGALSTALDGRIVWDRLLRQLSLVLPEGVWFETVQTAAPGATTDPSTGLTMPSTGAPTVTITGYAKTQDGLAQLLGRLGVLPQLGTVQLQSGTTIELGDEKVVQFNVAATLKQGGGAAS